MLDFIISPYSRDYNIPRLRNIIYRAVRDNSPIVLEYFTYLITQRGQELVQIINKEELKMPDFVFRTDDAWWSYNFLCIITKNLELLKIYLRLLRALISKEEYQSTIINLYNNHPNEVLFEQLRYYHVKSTIEYQ